MENNKDKDKREDIEARTSKQTDAEQEKATKACPFFEISKGNLDETVYENILAEIEELILSNENAENVNEMKSGEVDNLNALSEISSEQTSEVEDVVLMDEDVSTSDSNVEKVDNIYETATDDMPCTSSSSSKSSSSSSSSSSLSSSASIINSENLRQDGWHTVGIIHNSSTVVNSYIDKSEWSSDGLDLQSNKLPDLSKYCRINLEPGATYAFRLRAINTIGASDWSEPSIFKTNEAGDIDDDNSTSS